MYIVGLVLLVILHDDYFPNYCCWWLLLFFFSSPHDWFSGSLSLSSYCICYFIHNPIIHYWLVIPKLCSIGVLDTRPWISIIYCFNVFVLNISSDYRWWAPKHANRIFTVWLAINESWIQKELQLFWSFRDGIVMIDGMTMISKRIIIPASL